VIIPVKLDRCGILASMYDQNWNHFGRAVQARRLALGKSQTDIAGVGGPREVTMRKLERGHPGPYKRHTLVTLERALRWKPGAVEAILAGADPADWVDSTVMYVDRDNVLRSTFPGGPPLPVGPRGRVDPEALSARDWAVRALLDYADVFDRPPYSSDPTTASTRAEIFAFVRWLMNLPPHPTFPGSSPSGFVSQGSGGKTAQVDD
jgi:hypothetical protein